MKKGDVTVALLVLLIAVGLASCARVTVRAPSEPTPSVDEEVRTLVELINNHRKHVGCAPLAWLTPVARVAQAHSADMVRRNFFSHKNPDGLSPFQRLDSAGIKYVRAAENIAAGQRTGEAAFKSWVESAGHRRNIEDCTLREHGIGYTPGVPSLPYGTITNAWTHVFVRLRS